MCQVSCVTCPMLENETLRANIGPKVRCNDSLVRCQVSHVRCQMSGVTCQVRFPLSPVRCQASCVTFHKTERVKEIATLPLTSCMACVFCLLSGVQCQVSGLVIRCHLSSVRYQVSSLCCQVSPVNYHMSEKAKARITDPPSSQVSYVTCHVSGVMSQVSCVMCHVSHVRCHVSGVTRQVSHVTYHVSHVIYSFFLTHEEPKFCKICHACADYSTCLLFFRILVTLPVFMFFMIFQLTPPVLLPPANYCFHDQVITPLPWVPLKWPLHLVVICQNFGNFANFHVFHDFSTDFACPTCSHRLLFSLAGALRASTWLPRWVLVTFVQDPYWRWYH